MPTLRAAAPRHHRGRAVLGAHQSLAAARRLRHQGRIPRAGENPAGARCSSPPSTSRCGRRSRCCRCFADSAFILKRELMWIPFFGWYAWKAGMIPVDRGARSQALAAMTERARRAERSDRQIIIFPEGTRRPPGAEPQLQIRRRASLRRDRRALPADRAQFRPVLAAPLVPPLSRHGPWSRCSIRSRPVSTSRPSSRGCRTTSRRRPRGSSPKASASSATQCGDRGAVRAVRRQARDAGAPSRARP